MSPGAVRYPVMLHGFAGSGRSWGDVIVDGLAGIGHAPVLVDLPGHGASSSGSDPGPFTLEATMSSIGSAGDWPTDLLGYSMGGRLALHFAAAFPERVRSLVLESASPGLATEAERAARRASDEALAARIVDGGIEAFADEWESRPIFATRQGLPDDVRRLQRSIRVDNDPAALAAALMGMGTGSLPSLWSELPRIEVRTLLLVGELDAKFREIGERMVAAMPRAALVVVAGAGHTVHLERPDAWLDAVAAFWSE